MFIKYGFELFSIVKIYYDWTEECLVFESIGIKFKLKSKPKWSTVVDEIIHPICNCFRVVDLVELESMVSGCMGMQGWKVEVKGGIKNAGN